MHQHLLHFLNLFFLHNKSNSTFSFPPKDFSFLKYSLIYIFSFLSIQLLKELLWPFHVKYSSLSFHFYYFFNCKLFLICFLQIICVKLSISFFTVKITNSICPRYSIFNFFNHKNFFWIIWNMAFCKNIFVFWYFYMVTNFRFRILCYYYILY